MNVATAMFTAGLGRSIASVMQNVVLPARATAGGLPFIYANFTRLSVAEASFLDHNPSTAKRAMALGFQGREMDVASRPVSMKAALIGKRMGTGPEVARARVLTRFNR